MCTENAYGHGVDHSPKYTAHYFGGVLTPIGSNHFLREEYDVSGIFRISLPDKKVVRHLSFVIYNSGQVRMHGHLQEGTRFQHLPHDPNYLHYGNASLRPSEKKGRHDLTYHLVPDLPEDTNMRREFTVPPTDTGEEVVYDDGVWSSLPPESFLRDEFGILGVYRRKAPTRVREIVGVQDQMVKGVRYELYTVRTDGRVHPRIVVQTADHSEELPNDKHFLLANAHVLPGRNGTVHRLIYQLHPL